MTVRELIEKLQELENQNPANSYRQVIFVDYDNECEGYITSVDVNEDKVELS